MAKERTQNTPINEERRRQIEEEEKLRAKIRNKEEKRKQSKKSLGCLFLLLTPIIIIIIAIASSGGDNKPQSTGNTLSIGEEGILNNNDDPNDCSGETAVGVNKEDIEASINASVANDKEGFYELVASGRVFIVANCTTIRKIDSGGTLGSLAKIRFLEGTHYNPTGWIPYEFAKKKP